MADNLLQVVEAAEMEKYGADLPEIRPGDTVRVHVRIVEGSRERVQVFEGLVLGLQGAARNRSVIVRRMGAHGVGVERIFPLYSPRIDRFEVVRNAKVRRAKLYYMRALTGKKARLQERRRPAKK
ncbi:MAG: 50S ribosomal protein L19 [Anaerolineales bacterium]|nr:50S ribosomal protein L19 [Anaerolineales bacterium]